MRWSGTVVSSPGVMLEQSARVPSARLVGAKHTDLDAIARQVAKSIDCIGVSKFCPSRGRLLGSVDHMHDVQA